MRKLSLFFMGVTMACACLYGGNLTVIASAEMQTVYVGGMSAGFTLKTNGAQVIGLSEVITANGSFSPASQAGIRVGDIIRKIGGIRVETIAELNEIIDKSKGKRIDIEVLRGKEVLTFSTNAVQEKQSGRFKIGILVRENVSGIGTVTYIDKDTKRFGALGHSVLGEHNQELQIYDGVVYECSIVGVCKGVRGKAGELRGMFLNDKRFGKAEKLSDCGIYGQVYEEVSLKDLTLVTADSSKVIPGNAYIYSTVNGVTPKKYDIEIVKVDKNDKGNKNFVIKITDNALISETGGIVQGMSGSPILQEGKLVGAVTHVFLNDPTRGYGIDIEKMLAE